VTIKIYPQKKSLNTLLFQSQKKTMVKEVPYKDFSAFHAGNKVAITGSKTGPYGSGEIIVYDLNGKKLWEKGNFKKIHRIALAENSDKIIAVHDYNMANEECNVCFDEKGNKLWEKWITSPGITQLEGGIYGITTKVSGEDFHGKFQIFDLATGKEISHSIKNEYDYFFAGFINNRKVALLLQQEIATRDTALAFEVADKYHKLRKEGKIKEAIDLVRKTKVGWKKPKSALTFLIYDIPTKSFIVKRQLNSRNGKNFHTSQFFNNLYLSSDGNFFAVVGYNASNTERGPSPPYVIQILNNQGELLWEKNDFESVRDVRIVGNYLIVLDNINIRIFQVKTGEEIGNFVPESIKRGGNSFQETFIDNNKIILQINRSLYVTHSLLIGFDLNTKKPLPEILDPETMALIAKKSRKGVVFDFKKQSLNFIQ